jgi:hypothetical protein
MKPLRVKNKFERITFNTRNGNKLQKQKGVFVIGVKEN